MAGRRDALRQQLIASRASSIRDVCTNSNSLSERQQLASVQAVIDHVFPSRRDLEGAYRALHPLRIGTCLCVILFCFLSPLLLSLCWTQ